MGQVVPIKGAEHPPRAQQSKMETIIITPDMVEKWKLPRFQRPKRVNVRVREAVELIKREQVIEGILTLGILKSEPGTLYKVDGQHRVEAFLMSGLPEAIVDVRVMTFNTVGEMASEYHRLNSSLVPMRPDDNLRALEENVPALRRIRETCKFVGYDQVRRGGSSPIVSMSSLLRCWSAGMSETPTSGAIPGGAAALAEGLDMRNANNIVTFLDVAQDAWGRDPEHYRLWANLNLALCMWLFNKLVLDKDRMGMKKYVLLDIPQFKKCLMSVGADGQYSDWLVGRNLGDRDRSPAYGRLKSIFLDRLQLEMRRRVMLPQPAWASNLSRRGGKQVGA